MKPSDGEQQGEEQKPEARDVRKQLDELESSKPQGEQPEQAEDRPDGPRDPEQRTADDPKGREGGAGDPPGGPAWMVNLPPQIRDAIGRGDFEKVPPEYRDLIRRYLESLRRAEREEGPATGTR